MPKKPKWNEQACPACREPCAVDATICPHCRTPFSPEQVAARTKMNKSVNTGTALGCSGLILIFFLIGMCSSSDDKGTSKDTDMPVAAASKGDAKKDAIALYKSVITATAGCDAASSNVAAAMQGGDMVAAYRAADRAESSCLTTGSDIRGLEIADSIQGEQRESAEKAIEACSTAYVMKWSGAQKLKEVIDGDASPSALADLQETTETMQAGQMLCGGGLVTVATSLGATSADLGIEDDRKK